MSKDLGQFDAPDPQYGAEATTPVLPPLGKQQRPTHEVIKINHFGNKI